MENKCKKAKWLSGEALQRAVKRREAKSKGEKERYTHLNAEFQRIARRDKKAFLSDQCKEIEENTLPAMPTPRCACSSLVLRNCLLAVGGVNQGLSDAVKKKKRLKRRGLAAIAERGSQESGSPEAWNVYKSHTV